MSDGVTSALEKYLALVESRMSELSRMPEEVRRAGLVASDDQLLLWAVEALEGSEEFTELVEATREEYRVKFGLFKIKGDVEPEVRQFFRLSGLYQSVFGGRPVSRPSTVSDYRGAFEARESLVTYLAPLEGVNFYEGFVCCDGFEVRSFGREELDELLRNPVRRIFFPSTYIDTSRLEDYSFLVVRDQEPTRRHDERGWVLDARVPLVYSELPSAVQDALKRLALFDWHRYGGGESSHGVRKPDPWDGPLLPHIPFVIPCSESLIEWPGGSPDLLVLETVPVPDEDDVETIEQPAVWLYLDKDGTRTLEEFASRIGRLLSKLAPFGERWRHIEVAIGFLLKAFLARGMESLLWNITAIEAAVGEAVDGGVTRILRERTARILAETGREMTDARRSFNELYDFRSALVHGKAQLPEKEI